MVKRLNQSKKVVNNKFEKQIESIINETNQKIHNLIKRTREERENGLVELGNHYLNIVTQYELLDNLTSMDLIKSLSDQKLYDLYKLIVLDIRLSNNIKSSFNREEILNEIINILEDYKQNVGKGIQLQDINAIICANSSQKLLDFQNLIQMLLGDKISTNLLKLIEKFKYQVDHLIKSKLQLI